MMDTVGNILFTPWFTAEEKAQINAHRFENFEYIIFADRDRPVSAQAKKELDLTKNKDYAEVDSQAYRSFQGKLNTVTNEVMWSDATPIIVIKSLVITIGNALELTGRVIHQVITGSKKILLNAFTAIQNLISDISNRKIVSAVYQRFILDLVVETVKIIFESVKEVIRASYYCAGIELAVILGALIDPMRSRERVNLLAKKLNHGVLVKGSYQRLAEGVNVFYHSKAFYLAQCFQPWVEDITVKSKTNPVQNRYVIIKQSKTAIIKSDKENDNCNKYCVCCPIIPCFA